MIRLFLSLIFLIGLFVLFPKTLYASAFQDEFPPSRFGNVKVERVTPEMDQISIKQSVIDLDEERQYTRTPASEIPSIPRTLQGVQEFSIIASDLGYFPRTVFVNKDIPVRMFVTGSSKDAPLCMILDAFEIRRQIRVQEIQEITFVPTQAGKFRFYCPVKQLEGTLIVREIPMRQE